MGDAPQGESRERFLQPVIVGVISVAALMSAWASYQAALWNGAQTRHYSLAAQERVGSTKVALDASLNRAMEVGLFSAWLEAKDVGNTSLATLYANRFPPDLQAAFQQWLAERPFENPAAPSSPFRMPSYRQQGLAEAQALEASAKAEFDAGISSNRNAEAFHRGGTLLATAMFFGGIDQIFRGRRLRMAIAVMSLLACLAGLAQIFSLPLLTLPPGAGPHH